MHTFTPAHFRSLSKVLVDAVGSLRNVGIILQLFYIPGHSSLSFDDAETRNTDVILSWDIPVVYITMK